MVYHYHHLEFGIFGWLVWLVLYLVHIHILTYTYKPLGIRKISCHWRYKPSFNYIYLHIQIHAVVFSVAAFR